MESRKGARHIACLSTEILLGAFSVGPLLTNACGLGGLVC